MDKFIRGSLILTFSNLAVRSAGHVFRIIMGRFLAPSEFGLLNLALPLQYMVVLFASSGVAPSIAKFVAQFRDDEDRRARVLYSSLIFYSLIGAAIGAAFYLAAEPLGTKVFHEPEVVDLLRIASLAFPLGMATAALTGAFQGRKRFDLMAGTLIFQQLSRIAFGVVLVFTGYQAFGAILGSTLGFLAALPLALILLRYVPMGRFSVAGADFKKVFLFALPVSLTSLATFALTYADVLMIGYFLSPYEVGVYSAASPTSRLLLAFSSALYAVLLPSISEIRAEKGATEIRPHVQSTYLLSIGGLIPVVLLSLLFAEDIITLLFPGEGYIGAVEPFKVLVVGAMFLGIFTVNSAVFQGLGYPQSPMKLMGLAALLDVFLNALLIPQMGIMGAAYATALSFAFAGAASTLLLRRRM
jgi:stage V sporulation protein B